VNWNPHWDLSTIPDEVFQSEYGRRNALKREYAPSCGHEKPDPDCAKCRQRLYRRERRAQGKDLNAR
jgi:hypothetical protein